MSLTFAVIFQSSDISVINMLGKLKHIFFTGIAGPSHLPLWVSPEEEIQSGVRLGIAHWGLPNYSPPLNTSAASTSRVIDSPGLSAHKQ